MIGENVIHQLKKSNVSIDAGKTKQRVGDLYKASSKDDKALIEKLSGLVRTTVYKVTNTGGISAKLVAAMAQTLDLDPLYLTGESDDKGSCSDELLKNFLVGKDKSYEKLFADKSPVKRKGKAEDSSAKPAGRRAEPRNDQPSVIKDAAGESEENETASLHMPESQPANSAEPKSETSSEPTGAILTEGTKAFITGLSEDQMTVLMRSILLRAESGIPKYTELAFELKKLLITESF